MQILWRIKIVWTIIIIIIIIIIIMNSTNNINNDLNFFVKLLSRIRKIRIISKTRKFPFKLDWWTDIILLIVFISKTSVWFCCSFVVFALLKKTDFSELLKTGDTLWSTEWEEKIKNVLLNWHDGQKKDREDYYFENKYEIREFVEIIKLKGKMYHLLNMEFENLYLYFIYFIF